MAKSSASAVRTLSPGIWHRLGLPSPVAALSGHTSVHRAPFPGVLRYRPQITTTENKSFFSLTERKCSRSYAETSLWATGPPLQCMDARPENRLRAKTPASDCGFFYSGQPPRASKSAVFTGSDP